MIKNEISSIALHYQIFKFLNEHSKDYTEAEKQFILKNYAWGKREELVTDILRQIYDELGLLENDRNIYLTITDVMNNEYYYKMTCSFDGKKYYGINALEEIISI